MRLNEEREGQWGDSEAGLAPEPLVEGRLDEV
jgi:hypothetical protein